VLKQKFKKFERSKTPPKFRINETDFKILQDLGDYRYLDARQILVLHKEANERTLKRRLQLLFHAGFLDRPSQQFSYLQPSSHIIYALGKKGAKLIFSDRRAEANWTKRNKSIKPLFLQHALMVSNFRVVLTLALNKTKDSKLANWQEENLSDKVYLEGQRLPVFPDAFFTIEDKGDLLHFFLEADRSTMSQDRFLKKTRAYWQYWREEKQKKKFNISKFRVLTITISQERKDNLRSTTKKAGDNKQGSEMFLFACEKDYNLEKPESVLKPIWQSPKDDRKHHLLE